MPYLDLAPLSPSLPMRTVEETRAIAEEEYRAAERWMATQEGKLDLRIGEHVRKNGALQIRIQVFITRDKGLGPFSRILKGAWVDQSRDDCRRFSKNVGPAQEYEPFGSRHLDL